MAEICKLLEFLESRNTFSDSCSLRSIATGVIAGSSVNVDTVKGIGDKIFTSIMQQQNVMQPSFKRNVHVVTLITPAASVNNEIIQIDHQLYAVAKFPNSKN